MLNVLRIFFGLQHIQNALFVMKRNNTTDMNNNNNDNRVPRVVIVGEVSEDLRSPKLWPAKKLTF